MVKTHKRRRREGQQQGGVGCRRRTDAGVYFFLVGGGGTMHGVMSEGGGSIYSKAITAFFVRGEGIFTQASKRKQKNKAKQKIESSTLA